MLLWESSSQQQLPLRRGTTQSIMLVYGVTNVDGSGYNRMDDDQGIKSKAGGAIINGEYSSQETKAST